jgi:HAD superfamily hydrolase (TIGR01509 family)
MRAVLWDLDGTLVDSEEYHWLAWCETLQAIGVTITHGQFLVSFGQRNDAVLPAWVPGATPEELHRIGDDKEEVYRRIVREHGIAALPGAAEWVRKLNQEGWLQAIASSAPRANIDVMLQVLGLAEDFQAVVAAEDVQRGKPDPQVFQMAASRLGVPAERCVVVEDAVPGVEAARRAGMRSIGAARNGKPLDADIVVASLEDLPGDAFERLVSAAA